MKKDKYWLSEQIGGLNVTDAIFNESGVSYIDTAVSVERVHELIDQLDEPEVTLDRAFEKIAESYPMTKEEICRHLEQLATYDGHVTYGEPETLSEEWIDKNTVYADVKGSTEAFLNIDSVKNSIVPKQELPVVPIWFDKWWKDATKGEGNLFHNIERFYDELFSTGMGEIFSYVTEPDNKKKLLNIIVNELDYEVEEEQKLTARAVIEKHIELLKKQEEAVNLKPYYDLLERIKNE